MRDHADTTAATPDTVDLTHCDREPIHIPGRVQAGGCLIALSADWTVLQASENTDTILGLPAAGLIGAYFSDLFPPETVHTLRTKLQMLGQNDTAAQTFGMFPFADDRDFDVSIHQVDRLFIFEFARKLARVQSDIFDIPPLLSRLKRHSDPIALGREATRIIKAVTGFGRVMMYQFQPDGSGIVKAETHDPHLAPYLGLAYPASDIPKQARALYARNPLRLIGDIDAPTYPLIPAMTPAGTPLDLSMAVNRAVSPIHLQYLRNMGVKASMSASIMVRGKLWGLFACHHETPLMLDFERRTVVELLAQLFASEVTEQDMARERQEATQGRILHDRLMSCAASGVDLIKAFDPIADEISNAISCDGIAIISDGRYMARGLAPSQSDITALTGVIGTSTTGKVFATESLPKTCSDRVAGVLALPISRHANDFILLFRQEIAKSIRWAGNPDKPVMPGDTLSPRTSFAGWTETVKDHCAPWTDTEMQLADSLRLTLIEIVLRLADARAAERAAANERQEVLIAELNHRVRNILNLIKGLIGRTGAGTDNVADFTTIIDGRIQALARAHDLLTQNDWDMISLSALIQVEVQGFMADRSTQISVTGPDAALDSTAFSTVALVLHELMTNTCKYGALSVPQGRVTITFDHQSNGDVVLVWQDRNGPAVTPPTRRGFGTTIIEKSVPFELQGTAELTFAPGGVRARLVIPAKHISTEKTNPTLETQPTAPSNARPQIAGNALLVEDNMIIAMDAEDMLRDLGVAQVFVAGKIASALELLAKERIDFALLDVNLGTETSVDVAHALRAKGIPFVIATGYSGDNRVLAQYPAATILKKPYIAPTLATALDVALAKDA